MKFRKAHSKVFAVLLLGTLFAAPMLTVPESALAIPVEDAANLANSQATHAVDAAKETTSLGLGAVAFTSIVNLLTFAANRLAYDAAVMLASGGADQQPLIEYRSADAYFADYASAVAGQAVGLISENLDQANGVFSNFNLCAPSNPKVTLALKLGIRSAFRRPEPICSFNEVKTNWAGFIAQVASDTQDGVFKNELILTQLKDAFDPQTQEFSVGIQLYSDILGKSQQEADIAKDKLLFQGPTRDVVDVITGNVKTPSEMIKYDAQQKLGSAQEIQKDILKMTLANPEALRQIGISAASMFTNTLLSKLTDKLYSGLFDFDTVSTDPFDVGFSSSFTREDAKKRFSGLLSVTPLEVSDYDVLAQFGSCPRDNRGLYNCVVDSSFISAVARAKAGAPMTLAEAVDEGLVDGGWPLIPSADSARDQDPFCYTYGFCHANLVKLRKARIIPLGWEFAAESTRNSANNPVTLQEVMDGYDSCNSAGELDDNHPWCKLVDPNWVLKYPETQCKSLVYGQLLETDAAATRQQECVDMPSCIAEDENGTCTGGYGYCVAEKNTWNFRGDSCPAYAASCLTFDDTNGEAQSFLLNTVDYGSCDADNAGCLWYATAKTDADGDGTYTWPTVSDVAAADAADDVYNDRIYLTSAVEECDEENGGCSELYERTSDLALNVLPNPSFETDDDEDGVPDGWVFTSASASTYDTSGDVARSGDAAIDTGTGIAYQEGIAVAQGDTYTFSYYARQTATGTGKAADAIIAFVNENDTTESIDLNGLSSSGDCAVSTLGDNIMDITGTPASTTYERFTCTLTTPILKDRGDQLLAYVDIMAGDVWVDDVQFEQGDSVSDYHEGYTDSATSIVAKVAPAYLGCTGASTDPADCANYAQVCQESEVGCTQYSPANGDPDVFGITDSTDECPATCVGYDTFKQEATLYEPDGDFPVYFIPDSADECSQSAVGCDEFTKLDDESLAYFTYVRACLTNAQADTNTNGDKGATFYTWEGSDLDGYQLKTWTLLESNLDAYATMTYTTSGDTETKPGSAPCTSWTTDVDGVTCNDDVIAPIGHFDADTADCDEHDDIFSNPDCREFYDVNGYIHYREWSSTVTVNDACTSYRKTDLVGLNVDSDGDGTVDNLLAASNCTESGGYFDATLATCRYYGYGEESTECKEQDAGCREYTGGRSRNSTLVLEEQFEEGDLTNWEATSATDVTYSNESVATDGHSLSSDGAPVWTYVYDNGSACADEAGCAATTTGTLGGTCTVDNGDQYCGTLAGQLNAGKTYTLSFWAKGTGNVEVGFDVNADPALAKIGSGDPSFGTTTLSASGWQQYSVGPLNIDANTYADFGDDTVLVFVPASGVQFYVDNIVLREGEDNITVIKDSWVTPAECDEAPDGTSSPQYYLGCQEYTTQDGDVANLASFSSLCSEDVVGCSAYYATHESTSPYAQVFGATCGTPDGAVADKATDCYKLTLGASLYDTTSPFLCTIGVGDTSCSFDMDGYIPTSVLADASQHMTHIAYGPSTHIVPSDTPEFLVVGDDDTCETSAAGCTELGLPTFSADRQSIAESTSVYLMNDPSSYGDILCGHGDLFCAAWDAGSDGTYYFKDPQDQTCEYRTDVTVNGTTYDGWFRNGSDDFCYGTCASGANACSSDADCGAGDSCDASVGSYVIGGDQSGIWKNGDDAYAGWVGTCSEQYSSCSEFDDVLDVTDGSIYGTEDGAAYYYLDNASLEDSNLASSQKCDGQVSQKEGCALFADTTDYTRTANASATYVASTHADALFGDAPYALVDPIDCDAGSGSITTPDGTVVDLCSQRCLYKSSDVYDLTTSYAIDSLYVFGGSCYTADDCAAVTSESGESIAATCDDAYLDPSATSGYSDVPSLENDTNRVLKVNRDRQCSEWLSCSNVTTVWDATSGSYKTVCGDVSLCNEYSSTGNASFCSSWADDSTAAVLDTDRYVARDVSWYGNDYSGFSIPNTFPVELLQQMNVAPPTGYCEMSGVTSDDGTTYDWKTSALQGAECSKNSECNPGGIHYDNFRCVTEDEATYDLVYNAGSCDEPYGTSCTVGYCQETGEACSTSDDCGTGEGSCVVGTCYDVVPGSTCSADSDCSGNFTCLKGTCVEEQGDLDISYGSSCAAAGFTAATGDTLTLYNNVLTKAGSCIRDLCVLTAAGDPYDVTDLGGKECRGYPEQDSPFGNEVVEEWKNPNVETSGEDVTAGVTGIITDITTDSDPEDGVPDALAAAPDLEPYNFVTGFEHVKTCQAGEDCVCSYDKVTYGTGEVRYYADGSEYPDPDGVQFGICVGGDYDGVYCSADGKGTASIAASTCVTGSGTCNYATRKDTVTGLDGYCLERDTSINVNGNRDADHRACISWLPVDQLVGSTDIYAKFLTAGYFDESYVCTDTEPYADVLTSPQVDLTGSYGEGDISCAETASDFDAGSGADGQDGTDELGVSAANASNRAVFIGGDDSEGCAERVACPEGFWAVIGQPSADKGTGAGRMETLAEACDGGDEIEVEDCPYACVPYDAYVNSESDKSCNPEGSYVKGIVAAAHLDGGDGTWDYDSPITANDAAKTQVYIVSNPAKDKTDQEDETGEMEFDAVYKALKDCRAAGVEYDQSFVDDVLDYPASSGIADGITGGYCQYDYSCTKSSECGSAGACQRGACHPSGTCSADSECGSGSCVDHGAMGNSYTDGYRYYETAIDYYAACKEVTQVSGQVASGDTNVYKSYAWTDRLLGGGWTVTGATSTGLAYTNTDVPKYFGMTTEAPSDRSDYEPPFQVAVCIHTSTGSIILPDDKNSCPAGYGEQTREAIDAVTSVSNAETRSWIDFKFTDPGEYSSTSGTRDRSIVWTSADKATFGDRLNQVFAYLGFGDQYEWSGDQTAATSSGDALAYGAATDADDDTTLASYDVRIAGNPPTVWALDLANCEGENCEEGDENALTVNSGNSGDQESSGFFRAYLRFYAAADKNQLPIRRVVVDWQDDSATGASQDDLTGSDASDNFYKNHRGLQDGSSASKCDAGSTEWGLTPDSCESDYFSYSYIYTCSPGTVNTLKTERRSCTYDSAGNATNSPCVNSDDACVFRPRVHVRDNWGWCTGTCELGASTDTDNSTGCFDGYQDKSFMSPINPLSECSYEYYPKDSASVDNDPWVYYDGNIVVTP